MNPDALLEETPKISLESPIDSGLDLRETLFAEDRELLSTDMIDSELDRRLARHAADPAHV